MLRQLHRPFGIVAFLDLKNFVNLFVIFTQLTTDTVMCSFGIEFDAIEIGCHGLVVVGRRMRKKE